MGNLSIFMLLAFYLEKSVTKQLSSLINDLSQSSRRLFLSRNQFNKTSTSAGIVSEVKTIIATLVNYK